MRAYADALLAEAGLTERPLPERGARRQRVRKRAAPRHRAAATDGRTASRRREPTAVRLRRHRDGQERRGRRGRRDPRAPRRGRGDRAAGVLGHPRQATGSSIPYAEVTEELGYEIDAYSIQHEMSTHYGRMVADRRCADAVLRSDRGDGVPDVVIWFDRQSARGLTATSSCESGRAPTRGTGAVAADRRRAVAVRAGRAGAPPARPRRSAPPICCGSGSARSAWPQLMSSGRLELSGDPFLALRFPSLFRLPARTRCAKLGAPLSSQTNPPGMPACAVADCAPTVVHQRVRY